MSGRAKFLLAIALVGVATFLGVFAVSAYWSIREARFRQASRTADVQLLRFERDMKSGERIDVDRDLTIISVSKNLASGLGDVIVVANQGELKMYRNARLYRNASKHQFLSMSMLIDSGRAEPHVPEPNTPSGGGGQSSPASRLHRLP